jgi:hypothetical protein
MYGGSALHSIHMGVNERREALGQREHKQSKDMKWLVHKKWANSNMSD